MGRAWVKLVQKHDVGKNSTNFQYFNLYQILELYLKLQLANKFQE